MRTLHPVPQFRRRAGADRPPSQGDRLRLCGDPFFAPRRLPADQSPGADAGAGDRRQSDRAIHRDPGVPGGNPSEPGAAARRPGRPRRGPRLRPADRQRSASAEQLPHPPLSRRQAGAGEAEILAWYQHWVAVALSALEETLQRRPEAAFCFGDEPGWADLHLVPQLSTARRFGCDLAPYPRLLAVEARCTELDAFRRARPEAQPDFEGEIKTVVRPT